MQRCQPITSRIWLACFHDLTTMDIWPLPPYERASSPGTPKRHFRRLPPVSFCVLGIKVGHDRSYPLPFAVEAEISTKHAWGICTRKLVILCKLGTSLRLQSTTLLRRVQMGPVGKTNPLSVAQFQMLSPPSNIGYNTYDPLLRDLSINQI